MGTPPPPAQTPLHLPATDQWITGAEAELARACLAGAERDGLTGPAAWDAAGRALAAHRRTETDPSAQLRLGHAALDLLDEAARSRR